MKTNFKPEVHISMDKNRLKVYEGKNIYLKNNQEFSFEMFNPTLHNVMVRISINGKRISNKGVILKPGMRGWLDRYIDENRKFLFETYVVGKSKEVQQAISKNGLIEIEFFKEVRQTIIHLVPDYKLYNFNQEYTPTGTITCSTASYNSNTADSLGNNYRNTIDGLDVDKTVALNNSFSRKIVGSLEKKRSKSNKQETGRVEKGGYSDQNFKMVNMDFELYSFHTVEYKLLPESEKKVELKNLKLKCSNCGTKIKQGWKVCPVCTQPVSEKGVCGSCSAELEPAWKACPMCGEVI